MFLTAQNLKNTFPYMTFAKYQNSICVGTVELETFLFIVNEWLENL